MSPIVPIPGQVHGGEQERIDSSVLGQIQALLRAYKVKVTDAYGHAPHSPTGQHPKGLAADLIPDAGASWADVDKLAKDAVASGLFSQVLYDGRFGTTAVKGHGPPEVAGADAHLHLGFKPENTGRVEQWLRGQGGLPSTAATTDPSPPLGIDTSYELPNPADLPGAVANLAKTVAELPLKAAGSLIDLLGETAGKVLLTIGLVIGGVALALVGIARLSGLRAPSVGEALSVVPDPRAQAAATAIK